MTNRKMKVNYVIISGNPRIFVDEVVKIFAPEMIIIDGTNSRHNTKTWMKESEKQGVPCRAVTITGAVEKEF